MRSLRDLIGLLPRRVAELIDPEPLLELFLLVNIAGIGLDILVAHAINNFAHPWEWAPIYFSAVATVLYLVALALTGLFPSPGADRPRTLGRAIGRALGILIGLSSVVVGVVGLIFHLESDFFQRQTIQSLVYTAPFVAPLAYAGVGMLIVLNRTVSARDHRVEWGRWVVLLTMGGFIGNFVLSLADHAQNGFFYPTEWIGVIAGAFAVSTLAAVFLIYNNRPLIVLTFLMMGVQVLVGVLGFALHTLGNFHNPMSTLYDKFIFGAPAFAPMLFADVACLAALGLWALYEVAPARSTAVETGAGPLPDGGMLPAG